MAENEKVAGNKKDDDEYQFVDIESATPVSVSEQERPVETGAAFGNAFTGTKNVKRNALMVILLVVMMMVVYSVINRSSSNKKKEASITPVPVSFVKKNATFIAPQPAAVPTSVRNEANAVADINQKLITLELNQQNMRAELSSVNNQLNAFNGSMNDIVTKISAINQVLTVLTANMDAQSREIARLLAQKAAVKPAPVNGKASHQPKKPALKYYIQAVIPGRAWLIATNGATLTVREGTMITGYGKVQLIDSAQGRIITGSGQVIRFSQEDS